MELLQIKNLERIPVVDENGCVKGLVTSHNLMSRLIAGTVKPTDPAMKVIERQFLKVCLMTNLGRLSRILETEPFAVVLDEHHKGLFVGFVTQKDLLDFVMNGNKPRSNGDV